MKHFFRFILALVGTAVVYYPIFTYINYAFIGFSVVRAIGIALSVFIFYLAIRHNPWIIRLSHKMKMNQIERRGIIAMAAGLAISQMVLAEELSEAYNSSLLNQASISVEALIVDCEDGYCVCEYDVLGASFQQKFKDSNDQFESGDFVGIEYLEGNPNIYRLIIKPRVQ